MTGRITANPRAADLAAAASAEALGRLLGYQVRSNREWFDRSCRLLPLVDTRGASCIAEVTAIHQRILDRLERSPIDFSRQPTSAAASQTAPVTAAIALPTNNGQTRTS